MNPYRQIALMHLSIKELEDIIAELKRRENKIEVLTEEQKANHRRQMKMFGRIINY